MMVHNQNQNCGDTTTTTTTTSGSLNNYNNNSHRRFSSGNNSVNGRRGSVNGSISGWTSGSGDGSHSSTSFGLGLGGVGRGSLASSINLSDSFRDLFSGNYAFGSSGGGGGSNLTLNGTGNGNGTSNSSWNNTTTSTTTNNSNYNTNEVATNLTPASQGIVDRQPNIFQRFFFSPESNNNNSNSNSISNSNSNSNIPETLQQKQVLSNSNNNNSSNNNNNSNTNIDEEDALSDLTRRVNQLSVTERQEAQNDVYGYQSVNHRHEEDPMQLQSWMNEMDHYMTRGIKQQAAGYAALRVAMQTTSTTTSTNTSSGSTSGELYVKAQRLKFLRSTDWQPEEAVTKLAHYFELKLEYFGSHSLVRDLTLSDLSPQDLESWKRQGFFQLAEERDKYGRAIIVMVSKQQYRLPVESVIRVSLYFTFMIAKDEAIQKSGGVLILWGHGQPFLVDGRKEKLMDLLKTMPIRGVSNHLCYESLNTTTQHNTAARMLALIALKGITWGAVRTRVHQGTSMECAYNLMSYGIPRNALPINNDGGIELDFFHCFLDAIEKREHHDYNHAWEKQQQQQQQQERNQQQQQQQRKDQLDGYIQQLQNIQTQYGQQSQKSQSQQQQQQQQLVLSGNDCGGPSYQRDDKKQQECNEEEDPQQQQRRQQRRSSFLSWSELDDSVLPLNFDPSTSTNFDQLPEDFLNRLATVQNNSTTSMNTHHPHNTGIDGDGTTTANTCTTTTTQTASHNPSSSMMTAMISPTPLREELSSYPFATASTGTGTGTGIVIDTRYYNNENNSVIPPPTSTTIVTQQKDIIKPQKTSSIDTTTTATTTSNEFVFVPGPFDVIMGRGRHNKKKPGNQKLNQLLESYAEEYEASDKFQKTVLSEVVVSKMTRDGCKFIVREGDKQHGIWVQVSLEKARDKVAHDFRNLRRNVKIAKKNAADAAAAAAATAAMVVVSGGGGGGTVSSSFATNSDYYASVAAATSPTPTSINNVGTHSSSSSSSKRRRSIKTSTHHDQEHESRRRSTHGIVMDI